ncbi:hypothetical protein KHC23_07785 [Ancylobacter dichloromethanicus]|uniref:Uncharacterized protein n=1 Tax=Ancylobacter dichloromethanicus TaxID=518825 RepID=A0A9W6JA25_9HYPH|nr:hypothetical protein [Ancylobacter dichloromethanicus]MBS7553547.1 hypothetical protein [Ancylobacter dichloromethanicus]GLK72606.1 hypothetical protein GCM10017643_27220 [Ancylobacter dichloromethanicus]
MPVLLALLFAVAPAMAQERTFGGYPCTKSCIGHAKGYLWAETNMHRITECEAANSRSFREGCKVYVGNPARGAARDDQGRLIR